MSARRDAETTRTADRSTRSASVWRELLVAAATASVIVFLGVAALLVDLEAAAYAGGFALGLGLLRVREGRAGVVVLGLLSLNVLAWMSLAVAGNLRSGQGVLAVAIPAGLAALAFAAVVAAAIDLLRRSRPRGSLAAVRAVALAAALAFLVLVGAGAATSTDAAAGAEGDLVVVSDNVLFEPTELSAPVGQVTVRMANQDLFWHTFTIDELDVDLPVAVNGDRAATFTAPSGTYEYYCRIPGHEMRMRGTLVVTE